LSSRSPKIRLLVLALIALAGFVRCANEGETTNPSLDPECFVTPDTLDFGTVRVGSFGELAFTVVNKGGGTLSDSVGEGCPGFDVISGGGSYALQGNDRRTVTVRFSPADTGSFRCEIPAGSSCGRVECVGTAGEAAPVCEVSPPALSFDDVAIGATSDLSFTITNDGAGILSGTVGPACGDFDLLDGGGDYELATGQSRAVTVRFSPTRCGVRECSIPIGAPACTAVTCVGTGAGGSCALAPDSLDFGVLDPGGTKDLSFSLSNTGCDVLTGTVSSGCPVFRVIAGEGSYILYPGQTRTVTVRFDPVTSGLQTCTIGLANEHCGDLPCRGEMLPFPCTACAVAPTSLQFGDVDVGQSADLSFTIRNTGCDPISGTILESCSDFTITSGGGEYALDPDGVRTITVRFSPTACATRSCTIETGNSDCPDVSCGGRGVVSGCEIVPSVLDFGTVPPGGFADRTFSISNTGCLELIGQIVEDCSKFSLITGGGSFRLSPLASRVVTVRFSPQAPGTETCEIDMGNPACGPVSCTGVGAGTGPSCSVLPGDLDFGTLAVGESKELAFTITNGGSDLLTGSVGGTCPGFEILSGQGTYSLSGGESRDVRVRFAPSACGAKSCSIETGSDLCADVGCTGTGGGAGCSVSPTEIDFGAITVGRTLDRSFTISNEGCDPVTGEVSASCDGYEIASGGGTYLLAAGQSRTVTVRFTPTACGPKDCTIETGNGLCADVSCTGTGGGIGCSVSPGGIDFGTLDVGGSRDESFTITNTGCTRITGNVTENCPDYEITAGQGSFGLDPGEARAVTIRFSPTGCGTKSCTIDTGGALCNDVACTGTGGGAGCDVSPSSLDFGAVALGQHADRTFTITNSGCGNISGTIVETCPDYSFVSGGGSYSLALGQSRLVTVRFAPASCGTKACTIGTGNPLCAGVGCTGTGSGTSCDVAPADLDFGTVVVGQSAERSFTITNTGCDPFIGIPSTFCPDYSIVAGGTQYDLLPGQSHTVTVRFVPTGCGTKSCSVETGNSLCRDVGCTGIGGGTLCAVAPTTLDFGTVAVGQSSDRDFTITNTGCTTLTGSVSEACPDYQIVSGGGSYTLSSGLIRTVTVRFAPTGCGSKVCSIDTGLTACADVACTGIGGGSGCTLAPASLDFGVVAVGLSADRTFTITNSGCVPVTGTVSETCPDYSIIRGAGAFNLQPDAVDTIVVRFAPTECGGKPCTIETGSALCGGVGCTGTGGGTVCDVSPVSLDFGTVTTGQFDERTFTITNIGCDPLVGSVTESCPDYSITGGQGAYNLSTGQFKTITVRFTPTGCGTKSCTIDTGLAACADVGCTGTGGGAGCLVSPGSLNFGSVTAGQFLDRSFTITNTGCEPLTGSVSGSCADYQIIAGQGAYTLPVGESKTVTVRFAPTGCGTRTCTIDTGGALCSDVGCTGIAAPATPVAFEAIADATLVSATPDSTGCTPVLDRIGIDLAGPRLVRTLVRFDLSSIPVNATVTQADLEVYNAGCNPTAGDNTVTVDLYKLVSDWTECTVTWNNPPDESSLFCGTAVACDVPGTTTLPCAPLLSVIQAWVMDPASNYGLTLQPRAGEDGMLEIRSRRFGANPPRILIWYTCP
jgi:hypothetical protein